MHAVACSGWGVLCWHVAMQTCCCNWVAPVCMQVLPAAGVGQGLPNNSTLGLLLDTKHQEGAPGLPYPPTPSISDAQKPGSLNDAASSGSTAVSNPWSMSLDSSSGTA